MDERGGEYRDFLSKNICLTVRKNSVGGGIFLGFIHFGQRYFLDKGGGGTHYQDFSAKIFCLTVPKNLVREPFSVSLISGIERIFASEGYVTIFDFLSKFFFLTVPKIFVGEPFCAVFQKIFGIENVYG